MIGSSTNLHLACISPSSCFFAPPTCTAHLPFRDFHHPSISRSVDRVCPHVRMPATIPNPQYPYLSEYVGRKAGAVPWESYRLYITARSRVGRGELSAAAWHDRRNSSWFVCQRNPAFARKKRCSRLRPELRRVPTNPLLDA